MVELPRGNLTESRRGGAGVLELLLVDMQKRSETGYIRCEAGALGGAVGQITIREGTPSMVLFETSDGTLMIGHTALGAFQEASRLEGSQLSCHLDINLDIIEDLHPLARLHLDAGESIQWADSDESELWWRERQRKKRQWKKLDDWTDQDEQVEEILDSNLPPLPFHPGSEILPGMVALIDSPSPTETIQIASHLGSIGHPLLVISRIPTNRLESEMGIPVDLTAWLTEKGSGENTLSVALEEIRRKINDFLFGNTRACIVLDGLEFLSGYHGFNRTLDFIRSLVDTFTTSENLLLMPADLDVWDSRQRSILSREIDVLNNERVIHWAERPARLEGHPFCSDDWIAIEIPDPIESELIQPESTDPLPSQDVNRYSISGLVEAWREERHSELGDVATKATSSFEDGGTVEEDDDNLPEWALAPSANRGVETSTDDSVEIVDEIPELIEKEPVETEQIKPIEIEVKGPRKPTVNHRGNSPRRVRRVKRIRKALPDSGKVKQEVGELLFEDSTKLSRDGLALAASKATDVEAAVNIPGDAISRRDVLDSASNRVRLISNDFGVEDEPDMRLIGMNAAIRAASGSEQEIQAPPLTSNDAVREASSKAQRTLHLTGRLADLEKSGIHTMENAFSARGNKESTIWQRIKLLDEKGIETKHIIDMFEINPENALMSLEEAEK
ncbi:MAG: DUF835 domain-containing protein [Candidatus Thalassarchaeaceae archaeon]|nr:DUF835 domain-containing protein [Candidatus Thalassarchaeaceae archaeon]